LLDDNHLGTAPIEPDAGADAVHTITLTLEQRAAGALMSQFMQRQLSHRSENYALRSDIVYGSAD